MGHHDTDFALIDDAINNTAISTNSTEEQETATDELEAITNHLIRQVGQNAIEMLIGGLATFFCSILLIQGIKRTKQPGCSLGLLSPASPPLQASSCFW